MQAPQVKPANSKFTNCCRTITRFLLVCSVLLCSAAAMAQDPTTIFQLDGKPTDDFLNCVYSSGSPPSAGTECDYWNLLNGTGGSGPIGTGSSAGHSSVRTFINGTTNTFNFTGGGSKDPNDLTQWAYTSTSTPNKDTLNAAYAAAYNITDFDVIFGADRLSPNGDANIGIWFFQQSVCTSGGKFVQCGTTTPAMHVPGDVFIISSFVTGGGVSQIAAFTWDTSCASAKQAGCGAANLKILPTNAGNAFAITNSTTVDATWASYATNNMLASPLFFEGGLDITSAFGSANVPCFASFLEETRSSQSPTAVLKDFLLGGFPVCSLSISKQCGTATVNSGGTSITYPVNGTVTNTGIGTLFEVAVKDCIGGTFDNTGACTGTLNTISVGTIDAGKSANWQDSSTSTASSQADQAVAIASVSPNGTQNLQSTNTASASCSLSVSTTLTVSKTCSTTLVQAANGTTVDVSVSYQGSVCNTGPSQVTGISLKDYPDSIANGTSGTGTVVDSSITLAPGTSANPTCKSYGPHTYTPTAIDETINSGAGAGRFFFDDLITIPTATANVGTLTKVSSSDARTDGTFGFNTARCPICQGPAECTAQ
jgi:hypothetical protein